jgi:predicted nucleic acid-binding protein
MAGSALVDAGFLVPLLSRRDANHGGAAAHSAGHPPPWQTCDAVLSEAFHLLGTRGGAALGALLKRRAVVVGFDLGEQIEPVVMLMGKYAGIPMSLADACLVRTSETLPDPLLLTTDANFRIYRRHGRQAIPTVLP